MNRLPRARRARILRLLVEGMSLRAITRTEECSINTVTKLLVDAGNACAAYHDETVRGVRSEHIQVDEVWAFVYAKQSNVERARRAPEGAGNVWTRTALDADSKLIVSWLVGQRDLEHARAFMADLRSRVTNHTQLTSDGLFVYPDAVEQAFGAEVDFAQLVKQYAADSTEGERRYSPARCTGAVKRPVTGRPDPQHISTSFVERQNLNVRMGIRRFTRLTNAFSKKVENHMLHMALWLVYFNFIRIHQTVRTTPAMAAGLTDELHDWDLIMDLIEARDSQPGPRGPYRPHTRRRRRSV